MTVMGTLRIHPERKWTKDSTRETVYIEDMDTEHIKNSVNMIQRGYDIKGRRIGPEQRDKLPWLLEELNRRETEFGWDA